MTSYTVQQHKTTGNTHAIRWEGDNITGISDVFSQASEEAMSDFMLPTVAYGPYQSVPSGLDESGFVAWHRPTLEWESQATPAMVAVEMVGQLVQDWPRFDAARIA